MLLKNLRLQKGYTLREVSDDLGISLSTLSKWENGVDAIKEKYIHILLNYYKVDSFELPSINKMKSDLEKYKNESLRYRKLYTKTLKKYNDLVREINHYKLSFQKMIDLEIIKGE